LNRDIRVTIGFLDHPKTVKLKRRLGFEGIEALLRLWMFAAQYRPGGVLHDMEAEDIEIAVRWAGCPGELLQALVDVRFLDKDGDIYRLHDWEDHNGYASGAQDRSDKSRFSRLASLHPEVYARLKSQGIDAISAEEYRKITTAKRPLNESLTNRSSERTSPLPSPLPSPSPIPKEEPKGSPRKARGTPPADHNYFTRWWCFSFSKLTGSKFVYQKKHAGMISQLLGSLGLEELIRRSCFYLVLPEDKRWPRGSPTLEGLSRGINEFAGKCKPGDVEEKCFKLGILPDEGVTLADFTPWREQERQRKIA